MYMEGIKQMNKEHMEILKLMIQENGRILRGIRTEVCDTFNVDVENQDLELVKLFSQARKVHNVLENLINEGLESVKDEE
jgi:hypothetical protein